jgi:hypothetical protein
MRPTVLWPLWREGKSSLTGGFIGGADTVGATGIEAYMEDAYGAADCEAYIELEGTFSMDE